MLIRRVAHRILRVGYFGARAGTRRAFVLFVWSHHLGKTFTSTDPTDCFATKICLSNGVDFMNLCSTYYIIVIFEIIIERGVSAFTILLFQFFCFFYSEKFSNLFIICFSSSNFILLICCFGRFRIVIETAFFKSIPHSFKDCFPTVWTVTLKWIYHDKRFRYPILLDLGDYLHTIDFICVFN